VTPARLARPARVWHLEEVAGSFGEVFLADPHGPRIVGLEVPRGYRDAPAEEREVAFTRYVECSACRRQGCERCSFAGWTLDETAAKVVVPHGATPGTRLTVSGAGNLAGGVAQAIVVEIVEPGPRADELRAAAADLEGKLETAWQMDRSVRRRGRRNMYIAAVAAMALLAFVAVGHWLAKASTGESCSEDDHCRSGRCLSLLTVTSDGTSRVDGRMCSSTCTTDLDCPSTMHCTDDGALRTKRQYVHGAPAGRACIPNGY
jgi:hypothetical protein